MSKMQAKLPDDHGLTSRLLADDPDATHLIVAVVDVSKLLTDVDTGDVEPTVRILSAEIINTTDGPEAQLMLKRALEKRTGRATLDFDPTTGEVTDDGTPN